jgi:hypothetical protein
MTRAERIATGAMRARGAIEGLLADLGWPADHALSRALDSLIFVEEEHRSAGRRIHEAVNGFRASSRVPGPRHPRSRVVIPVRCREPRQVSR